MSDYLSKKILKKCEKYNYISFDLYDTLIKRNVKNPEDVFMLVENEYNDKHPNNMISNFANIRKKAYQESYLKYKSKCNIDIIYDFIENFSEDLKAELKKLECEIETKICVKNKNIFDLFEYLIKNNKNVIIITDMYLDELTIKKVLENCSIKGYQKLFLSSKYNASKTDGFLYQKCLEELGIKSNQLLHFGDGIKNDIIRAKMLGIKTIKVTEENKFDYYANIKDFTNNEKLEYRLQQTIISNTMPFCKNEFERIGCQTIGPLVFGFSKWLAIKLKELKIEKVFFLAREGKFFKEIFEMVNSDSFETHYLYVSRKSLVIPSYWINPDFKAIVNSISKSKNVSLENLLVRWGLKFEDCQKEISRVGIEKNAILDGRNLDSNIQIKELFSLLKNKIIDNSKEKYELLKNYLIQENFSGNCAIIDVGWNGSMQLALNKIVSTIDNKTTINGFYLGINTENLNNTLKNIHGYVYENKTNLENRYLIYGFAGPLELSLTASHGTTIGYKNENGIIKPILGVGEYILEDGTFTKELEYTLAMQNGARKYVGLANNKYLKSMLSISSKITFLNTKLFGISPKQKHIKLFYDFGANDLGEQQIFVSRKYRHLDGKYSITNGFWKSTWKLAYMKDIFKLPLPYYKIYIAKRKKVK